MKQILVAVALVMVGLVPGISQAAPIFSDDFNNETRTLNHVFADKWAVSNGTVDLVGTGFFFNPSPANGGYVDLDGSALDAGIMASVPVLNLGIGSYALTFDLAGSQRNDVNVNTLTFGIDLDNNGILNAGDITAPTITLGNFSPFGLQTFNFSLASAATARIVFGQNGGDNRGLLLDNVALNSRAVPEPASLMLLGAGLAAIGIWRRKATKV